MHKVWIAHNAVDIEKRRFKTLHEALEFLKKGNVEVILKGENVVYKVVDVYADTIFHVKNQIKENICQYIGSDRYEVTCKIIEFDRVTKLYKVGLIAVEKNKIAKIQEEFDAFTDIKLKKIVTADKYLIVEKDAKAEVIFDNENCYGVYKGKVMYSKSIEYLAEVEYFIKAFSYSTRKVVSKLKVTQDVRLDVKSFAHMGVEVCEQRKVIR
ncbi:hypothetical protein [Candidatus Epulonipiscium viviparus]|uniref:hypothetical protein n=1 Tax=Candidatus Epulonipiscium viviparus TaxID=420336 RepID=UPI0027380A89|nr:hypothetical protein [Candidatus Epulopiscium viviparus]